MDKKTNRETLKNEDRRDFLKKTSYVAPLVLTLPAMPSLAQQGSACDPQTTQCDDIFV